MHGGVGAIDPQTHLLSVALALRLRLVGSVHAFRFETGGTAKPAVGSWKVEGVAWSVVWLGYWISTRVDRGVGFSRSSHDQDRVSGRGSYHQAPRPRDSVVKPPLPPRTH